MHHDTPDPDRTADQTADLNAPPPRKPDPDTPSDAPPSFGSAPTRPAAGVSPSRFTPGDLIADRYRVVAFLGKGGMGEVYRADDLELAQSVAIKILPSRIAADPTLADRVRAEVRLARGITHRNVCRIHDVARLPDDQGGDLFISMEYVDGEDLATLLRRIGKLPQDKAVDVARQLCAALAAAHDQGVIHRDLKPANVMLDGRGNVRLTDFGIAALDAHLDQHDASSGTPAYMSPEQFAGEGVSKKSDIYALGLVIFELLTGHRAWRAESLAELRTLRETTGSPVSLTSASHSDIDPALAALVERCTESDPDNRPASALAVAAALPGADPLAAALAAGETPSPELIAASGGRGALSPRAAAIIAACAVALATLAAWLSTPVSFLTATGSPPPPAVMREEALEAIRALGYNDPDDWPTQRGWTVSSFSVNRVNQAVRESEADWTAFREGMSTPLWFWLRREPSGFETRVPSNQVWTDFPVRTNPGSLLVQLDQNRRLRSFSRQPNRTDPEPDATEPDWSVAFGLAGLDIDAFEPIDAVNTPGTDPVVQRAWEGPAPRDAIETDPLTLRVYAGARNGVITDFAINAAPPSTPEPSPDPDAATPDDDDADPAENDAAAPGDTETVTAVADRDDERESPTAPTPAGTPDEPSRLVRTLQAASQWILLGTITIVAVLLAYRNIRLGRADTRRATRLGIAMFVLAALGTILDADVAPTSLPRLIGPFPIYSAGIGIAFIAAACYIAAEPLARSRWPRSLVAWTRLFSGQITDPMVGRDLLLGILVGCAIALLGAASPLVNDLLGQTPRPPNTLGVTTALQGTRHVLANCADAFTAALLNAAAIALIVLLTMLLLGLVRIRQQWPAIAIVTLLVIAQQLSQTQLSIADRIAALVGNVIVLVLIGRVGLLATAAALASSSLLTFTYTATPIGEWWTAAALTPAVLVAAVLAFAYRTATAGRSLFGESTP